MLGRADVLLRKEIDELSRNESAELGDNETDRPLRAEVARRTPPSIDDLVSQYEAAAAAAGESGIAASLRLAVLAVSANDLRRARDHATHASELFDSSWARRAHSDADLYEMKALALLIAGQTQESQDSLAAAIHEWPTIQRFDSERLGIYELLSDEDISGRDAFVERVRRVQADRDS